MIILAEDDPELPISKMLSRYLDIQFTSSANGIRKALDEIGNRDAIIFIDRPPKYRKTEQEYAALMKHVKESCTDVYVFPIVCMEFIVLTALEYESLEPQYTWLRILRDHTMDYEIVRPYPPKKIGYTGTFGSVERASKVCLNNCTDDYINAKSKGAAYYKSAVAVHVIDKLPILLFKDGTLRKGIYGKDITDIRAAEVEYNEHYRKITKESKITFLDDKWWEVQ